MTSHSLLRHALAVLAAVPSERIEHGLIGSGAALDVTAVWLGVAGSDRWPLVIYATLFGVVLVLAAWYWSPAQRHRRACLNTRLRADARALANSLDNDDDREHVHDR